MRQICIIGAFGGIPVGGLTGFIDFCHVPSIEFFCLPNRLTYEEPTPYKAKVYKTPKTNRVIHRQSVNRGK